MESTNYSIANSHKRNTLDSCHLKPDENESNNSNFLVSNTPVLNGNTKTIEFVTDNALPNSENNTPGVRKFRKESLQIKIYGRNPTLETVSPNLRKDLDEYKKDIEKKMESENKIVSPLIIINEEEEEKKTENI